MSVGSEFMEERFQAAQLTHKRFLTTPAKYLLISADLNFDGPLVCSIICYIWYYTPEVDGSSVWQMSNEKYFAGVIYGQKSLMC